MNLIIARLSECYSLRPCMHCDLDKVLRDFHVANFALFVN